MRASRDELLTESAAVLARRYGVSVRTVGRWRVAAGVRIAPASVRHPMSDRDLAGVLLDDGASLAEAGRTVGVCPKTVRRWFPDRAGWSRAQSGAFGQTVKRIAS